MQAVLDNVEQALFTVSMQGHLFVCTRQSCEKATCDMADLPVPLSNLERPFSELDANVADEIIGRLTNDDVQCFRSALGRLRAGRLLMGQ